MVSRTDFVTEQRLKLGGLLFPLNNVNYISTLYFFFHTPRYKESHAYIQRKEKQEGSKQIDKAEYQYE